MRQRSDDNILTYFMGGILVGSLCNNNKYVAQDGVHVAARDTEQYYIPVRVRVLHSMSVFSALIEHKYF